jgi:hypothetical protein
MVEGERESRDLRKEMAVVVWGMIERLWWDVVGGWGARWLRDQKGGAREGTSLKERGSRVSRGRADRLDPPVKICVDGSIS